MGEGEGGVSEEDLSFHLTYVYVCMHMCIQASERYRRWG